MNPRYLAQQMNRWPDPDQPDSEPLDLHRPAVDELTWACTRPGCGGTMHRVREVADCLVRLRLDAGGAVALPVREPRAVHRAVSGRLHLRGDRPDARLVLHPARGQYAAVRPAELQERDLPGPHHGRRWQQDVEEPRQHRQPLVGARCARRRRHALVHVHRQPARQHAPLLRQPGERSRGQVPADAVEQLQLLRHLRQPERLRPGRARGAAGRAVGAGSLGAGEAQQPGGKRDAGARNLRRHRRHAADRRLRGRTEQLVCAVVAPAVLEYGGRGHGDAGRRRTRRVSASPRLRVGR